MKELKTDIALNGQELRRVKASLPGGVTEYTWEKVKEGLLVSYVFNEKEERFLLPKKFRFKRG